MRERAIRVAVLGAALSLSGRAVAEVVPLAELEKRAVARHALLAANHARTRAAAADVRQAESAYHPRIGVNVGADVAPGRQLLKLPAPLVDGMDATGQPPYLVQGARELSDGRDAYIPTTRTRVQLAISASLYDFGRTRAAIAASREKHSASEAEKEVTRRDIIAGVRGAYLSWLSAHQVHRLSESTTADAARRSQRTSALIQEGARPRGDLPLVEADRLLSQLEGERAAGELDAARALLEQQVGEQLGASAEPDPGVFAVQLDPAIKDRTDPSLQMLDHQRRSLEATARVQRKSNAPLLSAEAGFGIYAQTRYFDDWNVFPNYTAGLALVVPLWDGGSSRAAADAADARADDVRIRLERAELVHGQELERARRDVEHAERRAETAVALVAVCQTRVKDVEAGYEMGAMQFEQVQAARALLRRAETELVMARVARAEAVLRVSP